MRQEIGKKGLSYLPIFCSHRGECNIRIGRTCFLIINKDMHKVSNDPYIGKDELIQFGRDLCWDFDKEYFIFLDKDEVKTITKLGENRSTFSSDVMFQELVNIAIDNKEAEDITLYIRNFRTLSGKTSHGLMGEVFLWLEELPCCKEVQITEESKEYDEIK